jgi:Na+/H+ antiporter NhaC
VLAGAIFGDHCSPISDTTVLSSRASGCDHVQHVRTQMPYALVVGLVAILIGSIPAAFGFSPWLSLILGSVILWGLLRLIGRE